MKADDFETDIVEVLRENVPDAAHLLKGHGRNDFAEVFLFFDFDVHANNLREKNNLDALREMLGVFNNETELGKLYISYPMIEALRDRVVDGCHLANGHCHREVEAFTTYKGDSVKTQTNVALKTILFWSGPPLFLITPTVSLAFLISTNWIETLSWSRSPPRCFTKRNVFFWNAPGRYLSSRAFRSS